MEDTQGEKKKIFIQQIMLLGTHMAEVIQYPKESDELLGVKCSTTKGR